MIFTSPVVVTVIVVAAVFSALMLPDPEDKVIVPVLAVSTAAPEFEMEPVPPALKVTVEPDALFAPNDIDPLLVVLRASGPVELKALVVLILLSLETVNDAKVVPSEVRLTNVPVLATVTAPVVPRVRPCVLVFAVMLPEPDTRDALVVAVSVPVPEIVPVVPAFRLI